MASSAPTPPASSKLDKRVRVDDVVEQIAARRRHRRLVRVAVALLATYLFLLVIVSNIQPPPAALVAVTVLAGLAGLGSCAFAAGGARRAADGDARARRAQYNPLRILVLRRFSYTLDLQCLSSILPVLCTIGAPRFMKNPEVANSGALRDPGTAGTRASQIEPTKPIFLASQFARWSDAEKYDKKSVEDQVDDAGAASFSRLYLHPNRYAARVAKTAAAVELLSVPSERWVGAIHEELVHADLAVVDLTGFGESIELELGLLRARLSANRIVLLCHAVPEFAADQSVMVGGHEVYFYQPSLWGAGSVCEYLLRRSVKATANRDETRLELDDAAVQALQRVGEAAAVASRNAPPDLHFAVAAHAGWLLSLFVLSVAVLMVLSIGGPHSGVSVVSGPFFCALVGAPVMLLVAVAEYFAMLRRFRTEVSSQHAAGAP